MTKRLIIGWVNGSPVYALRGADSGGQVSLLIDDGDDDEDLDDDEDDDPDGDAGGSGDGQGDVDRQGDDWPPSRDEWNRVRHTARVATRQAVERKRLLREHGLTPSGRKSGEAAADGEAGGKTAAASDREAAIAEARERSQREDRLVMGLKRKALQAELREADWVGDDFKLASRMIDFDAVDLEFDDAGEPVVVGLSEQVAAMRQEIPAWFRRQRKTAERPVERSGAEAVDGGHRAAPPAQKPGWRRQVSDQLGGVVKR